MYNLLISKSTINSSDIEHLDKEKTEPLVIDFINKYYRQPVELHEYLELFDQDLYSKLISRFGHMINMIKQRSFYTNI